MNEVNAMRYNIPRITDCVSYGHSLNFVVLTGIILKNKPVLICVEYSSLNSVLKFDHTVVNQQIQRNC